MTDTDVGVCPEDTKIPVFVGAHVSPMVAIAAVGVLGAAIVVLLGWVLYSAHTSYSLGLMLVKQAAAQGYHPTSVARRVFLLAAGEQIAAFKVASFGISALLGLVGGVFILNGAEATYRLALSNGGSRAALQSTSPGLVIMTLSMALAAFTLSSKSELSDHRDFDVVGSELEANPEHLKADNEEASKQLSGIIGHEHDAAVEKSLAKPFDADELKVQSETLKKLLKKTEREP